MESKIEEPEARSSIPTPEELLDKARAMIPVLRKRAEADEKNRKVDPCTIAEMKDAGFFRVLQPRRYGGYEMDPEVFNLLIITLAEGDMSAAWVYGVVGVHAYHLGLFDDRAAQDVWGQDSSVLISSPYAPTGTARRVPGGFEFSGRWAYSSGAEHCPWTFLGGLVEGEPTDNRAFLLPREDAKIVDTWQTLGLAATGSHDVVVDKAFVPEYRTHRMIDGFNATSPGRAFNDGPNFRMPLMQIFLRAITSSQIGALQALLDLFREYAESKVSLGTPMVEFPEVKLLAGEAATAIWEMKSTIKAVYEVLGAYAAEDVLPPMEERMMFRNLSAEVADRCVKLAEGMVQATGGGLVYDKVGFNRIYRNMVTGRQHVCAQYQPYARRLGGFLFGDTSPDFLL